MRKRCVKHLTSADEHMPVRKFRSAAEIPSVLWVRPGTEEHTRALKAVFATALLLAPPRRFRAGVFKYRAIEEAQAQRRAWCRPPSNS